jgi:hypothetical protein
MLMMKWQGDDVFYSGSPISHGSNAEFQLMDARSVAKKVAEFGFRGGGRYAAGVHYSVRSVG